MKKTATRYTGYLILGIIVVFSVITGVTYAIFKKSIVQNSTNIISTLDCINVSITGNNSSLTLSDAYPLSDNEGMKQTPYRFTLENNCNTPVEYQIIMSIVNTSTITNNDYVKVDLDGLVSNRKKMISELPEEFQQGLEDEGFTNNYTLGKNSFSGNESHVYNFRMWLNGNNEDIWTDNLIANQNITVKLSIIGITKKKTADLFLKDKILGVNNANVTTPLTEPGKAISIGGEAVLASAEDDYGTSYYFRGAVTNNYILFADMCWRIVRVTGDGSIKLVLYNYNTGASSCSGTGSSYAFARYSGSTYTTVFNEADNSNSYVGFMYGIPGSATYAAEHANTNKSTILTNLETWYSGNLAVYKSQLADTIWCNDKSVDTAYPYGTILGYGTNQTGYSTRGRIFALGTASNAKPTLECPNDTNGGKLSKFTVSDIENGNGNLIYKIGLLTADEVAYAGGMHGSANSTYYLNQNANSASWWSLSPYYMDSSGKNFVYYVYSSGFLNNDVVSSTNGLRPAVSLKSTTTVTGNGTSDDPYKVVEEPTLKDKILAQEGGPAAIEGKGASSTSPGKQISTAEEKGLFATLDDYGTSYYFRGAVENNYIMFADMCWRIVRVTGDGSIKLVLYNYNTGANSCSGTGGTYALARYSGSTYTTKFNEADNSNSYVGFMYGTSGSATYAAEHANTNKSTILTNLEMWYTNNLAVYESKLADTIWCNDKSVDTAYPYGTILGYGSNQTGYSARGRIYAGGTYANAEPTLKCPNDTNGGKLSKFTVSDIEKGNGNLTYKIGLLTADEVAYAGAMYGTANSTYYLNQNATGASWWSLSPYVMGSAGVAFVWYVSSSGYLYYDNVGSTNGLRPAVSLKSTTTVTGEGTSTDPFVVK